MNVETIAIVVAASAPLIFAVLGETLTEKVGVVNLSLDGSMLLAAMTGFAVAFITGSIELGFLAAALISSLVALIIVFTSIELRLNQIAIGLILTLLATELAAFFGQDFVRQVGPSVQAQAIPYFKDIPYLGRIFFDQNLVVYGSFISIAVVYLFLFHTRHGLELQSVGERPEAAFAKGIPVNRLRYIYTAFGGALVGIGGAAFSLEVKLGWSEGHIANFGWIALAIVIFGGWHPIRAALGCYIFGALQIIALRLQPELPGLSQVLPILPFPIMILTLVAVNHPLIRQIGLRTSIIGKIVRSDPPAALGKPFWRE